MTDTRKEFERAVSNLGWAFDYIGDGQYGSHTIQFANKLWQACQSLNDKRIEQMLAVIAKKDEALKACSDAMEYMSEYDIPLTLAEDTEKALALQPSDVELVEVGRWVDEGNSDESDFYPVSYCGREGSGDMCYTIKTKGK